MIEKAIESAHSLSDMMIYNLSEDREDRQRRLAKDAIASFTSMWNEKFGPLSFEADVTYGLGLCPEAIESAFINIYSVADNFRMLVDGKWAYLPPAFRHRADTFNRHKDPDGPHAIDPRGLEPIPDFAPGPIDEKVFDALAKEFKQLTGIYVGFVCYKALKPIENKNGSR